MTDRLPLFPLGTVLFPGLVLPLHVFEERYRALIRHVVREQAAATEAAIEAAAVEAATAEPATAEPLTSEPVPTEAAVSDPVTEDPGATVNPEPADDAPDEEPSPGTFGVVAIRRGWESGGSEGVTLQDVGCTAEIRQLTEHADGRFDLVTVGRRRFRILDVHRDEAPFLVADVEWLPESDDSAETERLVPGLLALLQRYLELIRTDGRPGGEQMPDDPTVLSYLIAATVVLTLDDRQQLLEVTGTTERLTAERRLLNREMALLKQIRALPVPLSEFATPPSAN